MSSDERRDSLADQAAAWVPPWQRPTPPSVAPDTPDTGDLGSSEPLEGPEPTKIAGDPDIAHAAELGAGFEGAGAAFEVEVGSGFATVTAGQPAGPEEPTATAGQSEEPVGPEKPTAASGQPKEPAGSEEPTETEGQPAEPAGQAGAAGPEGAEGERGAGGVPAGKGPTGGVPAKGPTGRRRATPEPAPELDDAELRGALEAILLVVDEPVSELTLAQVLEQSPERIGPMLDEIAAGYTAAGHGFELRRAAGGWRLYTRPEYATYVERFVLDGQSVRLTQAALETLAVVAYKQPVTRSRISAIRGVNCDGVIRTLVSRGLVEECGTEPDSGAFLYRTTTMFLEKLGLNSVDDLPPLAPFLPDDVEELADATR
ncbi:SMC-Scp complex subunit ScpB [Micromonospora peucetia]|uniref:SMC-Scp complex subunit ScpB n=1 Tax=Micromonospora peucetia TaxID=47871 RepID=A0A1C6W577_9ACTN|nr:SMC-Scp complex subunit ScpB [Micromonospora peucetia]WSA32695.1 SMC-Scp complex subunit ScpB [Micromonospora peucetia]SCL73682.1 segregation and condensation protein B [Micromonospora peucetia]